MLFTAAAALKNISLWFWWNNLSGAHPTHNFPIRIQLVDGLFSRMCINRKRRYNFDRQVVAGQKARFTFVVAQSLPVYHAPRPLHRRNKSAQYIRDACVVSRNKDMCSTRRHRSSNGVFQSFRKRNRCQPQRNLTVIIRRNTLIRTKLEQIERGRSGCKF